MVDGLHAVRVLSNQEEEELRDLVRAREDVRGDLMRARHRLSKLLLRHDVRFDGTAGDGRPATGTGSGASISVGRRRLTLLDYLGALDALIVRRDTLEGHIEQLVPDSPWAQAVARLRCLRGIDTLSAVGLCAEIGDFAGFQRPGRLMSFLGLVPSEHSSGERRAQGQITKPTLSWEDKATFPISVQGATYEEAPGPMPHDCERGSAPLPSALRVSRRGGANGGRA